MVASIEERKLKRAEIVRRLQGLVPKQRLDAMLEEVDGKALVRSLPAEDVYATVVDVGLSDATDVVQLATPEQFRTFVDLAAWQKDRIDPLEVLRWLRAARSDDDEDFVKKLKSLDIEVVELLYKKLTSVHDLEENPDANPDGVTIETPEGKFLIELNVEGADQAALRQLSMDLMAHNPFELARFLEAVRWEMPSELEEVAYQFRSARLADLGFPSMDEAIKLFAWVDPAKFASPVGPAGSSLASVQSSPDYVAAAFAGLSPEERDSLEAQVRYLVNSVLVAEGAEPGDPPAIRRISEQARDYLNLSLEHFTGGDPHRAADVLREHPLKTVFQVGFSLTLQLKREVERLAGEAGSRAGDTWVVLDEEAAVIAALLRRRPLKALRVPGAEPVPFRNRRELREAEAVLQRVRLQRDVFGALWVPSRAEVVARFGVTLAELTPQRLFLAAVARADVLGDLGAAPYPAAAIPDLVAHWLDADQKYAAKASAGDRAAALLAERVPAAAGEAKLMVERVVGWLQAELAQLIKKDGSVDPKKLAALPIEGQATL